MAKKKYKKVINWDIRFILGWIIAIFSFSVLVFSRIIIGEKIELPDYLSIYTGLLMLVSWILMMFSAVLIGGSENETYWEETK